VDAPASAFQFKNLNISENKTVFSSKVRFYIKEIEFLSEKLTGKRPMLNEPLI